MSLISCPRDSGWCDGVLCVEYGLACPNADCAVCNKSMRECSCEDVLRCSCGLPDSVCICRGGTVADPPENPEGDAPDPGVVITTHTIESIIPIGYVVFYEGEYDGGAFCRFFSDLQNTVAAMLLNRPGSTVCVKTVTSIPGWVNEP